MPISRRCEKPGRSDSSNLEGRNRGQQNGRSGNRKNAARTRYIAPIACDMLPPD
jgi:hypothetical protein